MPFTITSNKEEVTVQRSDEAVKKPKAAEAEERPEGLVNVLIYYVKKVLTFKVRG